MSLLSLLPHKDAALLLTAAELDEEQNLICSQVIRWDHPGLAGHFPEFPIWPGHLLIEAMAQSAALLHLLRRDRPLAANENPVLGAVQCRLLKPVFPGDRLEFHTKLLRAIGDGALFSVEARRDQAAVATARITAGISQRGHLKPSE